MSKTKRYLESDPWVIIEKGFHEERSRVSEAIFSLANEYMGVRGHFEEGYSGNTLIGSYVNGVFDEHPHHYPTYCQGFPKREHFMVNAVNWLYTRIAIAGETLDLASSSFSGFERCLDLRRGVMTRSLVWKTLKGKELRVTFIRFLGMKKTKLGFQRIILEPLNFSGKVSLVLGMDLSPVHENKGKNLWQGVKRGKQGSFYSLLGETSQSGQKLLSAFKFEASQSPLSRKDLAEEKFSGVSLEFALKKGVRLTIDRVTSIQVDKRRSSKPEALWKSGGEKLASLMKAQFDSELIINERYWKNFWNRFDMKIEGDPENDQGTRYCIFQMHSTYHGVDPQLNVGAKGLTGEAYGGLAFWDTETYCLPFYLFTDQKAAVNLLKFRYNTLEQAKERARQLGCKGARYPMSTIDGTEACGVWHHGDLEIHVPAAVAYGIWHYVNVTGDRDFLFQYGVEMLVEISRFYASHGNWSPKTGEFGLWGVMGADEFHMMVHNNAYTNTMAKKTFEWTLKAVKDLEKADPSQWKVVSGKTGLQSSELADWKKMARKMRLNQDPKTGLIEQHDGYFDLPEADVAAIAKGGMSICKTHPYISRSRFNWIKQPDVILLQFFFSGDYTRQEKQINFDTYEPKCAHESSLSPGVHSILAAELGNHQMAFDYVKYASRMDLDDYNGNTDQGLHMTSMAAAWMSLVYGFGGMRSDGRQISFRPNIPAKWNSFSFRVEYRGGLIELKADRRQVTFTLLEGSPVTIEIYGKKIKLGNLPVSLPVPSGQAAKTSRKKRA